MSQSLLPELSKLIGESLHLEPAQIEGITHETSLESLGITSLELMDIVMNIEEEYDIQIDVDTVEARDSLNTVGELLELGKQHGLGRNQEAGDA